MAGFKMVHVISPTKALSPLPRIFLDLPIAEKPYWLLSYPKLMGSFAPTHFFKIASSELTRWFFYDSGGASDRTGAIHRPLLVPSEIASRYQRDIPHVGFGPDLPPFTYDKSDFESALADYLQRRKEFYSVLCNLNETTILEVIHGNPKVGGQFSLEQKVIWLNSLGRTFKEKKAGAALPLPDLRGIQLAYFALLPWSRQITTTHILGVGNPEAIALLVYVAYQANLNISCDCKTYTIDAAKYGLAHLFDENGKITSRHIESSSVIASYQRHLAENDLWKCYDHLYKKTIHEINQEIKIAKASGHKTDRHRIDEWLAAGNVFTIQKFVEQLKERASSKSKYRAFLKSSGYGDSICTLDFIDKILSDGRRMFRSHLSTLNNEGSEAVSKAV